MENVTYSVESEGGSNRVLDLPSIEEAREEASRIASESDAPATIRRCEIIETIHP